VVVACDDVVDGVGSWVTAQVAYAVVAFHYDEAAGVPVGGESLFPC
jgi:hypothetical protein